MAKESKLSRRNFIGSAAAATALGMPKFSHAEQAGKFKLKYAPHLKMFKANAGLDAVDQIKFMADNGFRAFEDNKMHLRDVSEQKRMSRELEKHDMTMGVFVAYGIGEFDKHTFVHNDREIRDMLVDSMKKAVEVAKRVNATWFTVVPGAYDPKMEWDYQTANVIDNLKACAEVCEPAGKVMVLESLNWWSNHPGLFLHKIPQAYQICKAVASPSCKILDDLYHQQISEGNLIPNMEKAWDEIAYIQVGDNPGRKEPTTGEINYKNIFKWLFSKGFKGVIGMEHGNSRSGKDGELAVIEAYRQCDNF
jgi:hydroxypyruvate isomerase